MLATALAAVGAGIAWSAEREARCVVVDVYLDSADSASGELVQAVERFAGERTGLAVTSRFVDKLADDRDALAALGRRHGFDATRLPVVHACSVAIPGRQAVDRVVARLRSALQVEVFVRAGCARCAAAKEWLPDFQRRYPGIEVVTCDIAADRGARDVLSQLVREHGTAAASVPVFHLCNQLVVGYDRPETSGRRLEKLLDEWTRDCRVPVGADAPAGSSDAAAIDEAIDVPFLGRLDPARLGMPLFTLAIGLVDGFNPCAMWVLLLMLSVLVNLRSRSRILAVAGTFVVVSGLAYFAFMAAWLNVFEWIGMLRPVQVALGLFAVMIGAIHVKDFVAFKQGPSLSIPEAAKPGIYAQIRRIVTAENLAGAMVGAFVLAVLVNVVELLCTAGLPALYTDILSQRGYSAAVRYGYLALYIAAYMFDDTLMVAGVTATLSKFKLQESGGRWLKLLSGGVILALGLVMLLRPEWLEG